MIEHLFQVIALSAYLFCAFRIICYNRNGADFHRGYAWLAAMLIAACLGQAVHILFFKDPVTVWDAFFAVLLAVIFYKTKGNVAKLIWSPS